MCKPCNYLSRVPVNLRLRHPLREQTCGQRLAAAAVCSLLSSTCCLAQLAPDVATVLAGWRSARVSCQKVGPYVLSGTSTATVSPRGPNPDSAGVKPSTHETTWSSLVDGKRYRTVWSPARSEEHVQTFDGERWYGLTTGPSLRSGTRVKQPEKTPIAVNIDDHLRLQFAAEGCYLRLEDIVDRPVSSDGVSLLEKFEGVERSLSSKVHGATVSLVLAENVARQKQLPEEMTFVLLDGSFYPSVVRYGGAAWTLEEYHKIGNAWCPSRIVGRFSSAEVVARYDRVIECKLAQSVRDSDFRIEFEPGTSVLDDSLPRGSRSYTVYTVPAPWGSAISQYLPWILTVVLGGLAVFLRIKTRGGPTKRS